MKLPEYPLAQVLSVKIRRVEEAELALSKRSKELEKEKEILIKKEQERDKVKQHKRDKLNQMREAMDSGTTSQEILQMKAYLKIVDERVVEKQVIVDKQVEQVKVATRNVELAKEEVRSKQKEVDKLEEHRVEWTKEIKKEIELKEAIEADELGSIMFMNNKKKNL